MKTVSFLLVILVLAPAYNARPQNFNLSQSGNIKISTINGVFKCDEMQCPADSVKCSVSAKTTKDLTNIDTVRKCFDSNGVATKEEHSTSPNPYPGSQVSNYSEASRTGSFVNQQFHVNDGYDSENDAVPNIESMNAQLQEWHDRFLEQMDVFNTNFNRQMQSFRNVQFAH